MNLDFSYAELHGQIGIPGYKVFELKHDMPHALMHGMPIGHRRSRMYRLDQWRRAERGTPGFNAFLSEDEAMAYISRFRKARSQRFLTRVLLKELDVAPSGNYYTAGLLYIPRQEWRAARPLSEIIEHSPKHLLKIPKKYHVFQEI